MVTTASMAAMATIPLLLGMGDRLVGAEGADRFFATSGGGNTLTGSEGADQFWIATAEFPDAVNSLWYQFKQLKCRSLCFCLNQADSKYFG